MPLGDAQGMGALQKQKGAASSLVGKRQRRLLGRIKEELWAELGNDFTLTESSERPKEKMNYETKHAF